MSQQTHRSDSRVLNTRTLERHHRRLAALLTSGMRVMDVGCGTGAITAGIARAVGPVGQALGIDRDAEMLVQARTMRRTVPNLQFQEIDILDLNVADEFDVVTAARCLQWISDPARALENMVRAAKRSGWIVVLDYSHSRNSWEPEPPASFRRFYQAWLDWRAANGWDNRMAESLPDLFDRAGFEDIQVSVEDEIAARGDAGFDEARQLWPHVIDSLGFAIIPEPERRTAHQEMAEWCANKLQRQTLFLRAVTGRVP